MTSLVVQGFVKELTIPRMGLDIRAAPTNPRMETTIVIPPATTRRTAAMIRFPPVSSS